MTKLFVYDSLLLPEIREKLIGKKEEGKEAILNGFKRVCVLGEDYPALIRQKGHCVKGEILFNVDETTLKLLTIFEGDEHDLRYVSAEIEGKQVSTQVFLWKTGLDYTIDTEWSLEKFEKESLENYVHVIVPETIQRFHETNFELF